MSRLGFSFVGGSVSYISRAPLAATAMLLRLGQKPGFRPAAPLRWRTSSNLRMTQEVS